MNAVEYKKKLINDFIETDGVDKDNVKEALGAMYMIGYSRGRKNFDGCNDDQLIPSIFNEVTNDYIPWGKET